MTLPSRKDNVIGIYVFLPPKPVDLDGSPDAEDERKRTGEWKVPVVLDFHGGGFIMGSPLEQAPYASMMSRELGAVVISVSYRIGPFHQFPAAIHDAEDVLSAILDTEVVSKAGGVLRTEVQRYFGMDRSVALMDKNQSRPSRYEYIERMTLDPSRLAISGFSAGGNIALNMAITAPPCPELSIPTPHQSLDAHPREKSGGITPMLPPNRAPTMLNDVNQLWPTMLPPPQASPRMIPLLLFYPSLDARLLPHERPMRPMPKALDPNNKEMQRPRTPGLFSIMGPTYLPRKLRPHPRASPGLVSPDNVQKNAAILIVLPEKDTLAVQSDVWVDRMNQRGWQGPVHFGDGREGDWDGHNDSSADCTGGVDVENGGLEVWHSPGSRHGWTQFPDTFVGQHERTEREMVFARALDFVKENWNRRLQFADDGRQSVVPETGSLPVAVS